MLVPFFNGFLVFYAKCCWVCSRQATPPTPSTQHIPQSSFSHRTNRNDNVCIRLFAFTRPPPHTAGWIPICGIATNQSNTSNFIFAASDCHTSLNTSSIQSIERRSCTGCDSPCFFRFFRTFEMSPLATVACKQFTKKNREKEKKSWYAYSWVLSGTFFPCCSNDQLILPASCKLWSSWNAGI